MYRPMDALRCNSAAGAIRTGAGGASSLFVCFLGWSLSDSIDRDRLCLARK